MAKISKVTIKDVNTLILNESANVGDYIDLLDINQIDTSIIAKKISEGADAEYNRRLKEVEKQKALEQQMAIVEATAPYEQQNLKLQNELENIKKDLTAELSARHTKELNDLNQKLLEALHQLDSFKKSADNEMKLALAKKEQEWNSELKDLQNKLANYELIKQNEIHKLEQTYQNKVAALENTIIVNDTNAKLEAQKSIGDLQAEINRLRLNKSRLNIKLIGEELERWCNNEYLAYAQNGFQTCTWEKDNAVVKDESDTKGSKADYIFKVYATDEKLPEELLTSVTCEMKNEAPDSVNKKKNSDYYAKLDKDRIKKKCEYALLVSELEWDQDNDVPVQKVIGYEKMYMVRPQYLITFLNIIASLGLKFKDVLLEHNREIEQFKESQEIIDEFEKFKETILDKPLISLAKEIESIVSEAQKIKTCSDKIMQSADKMTDNILKGMKKKIEDYNIRKITKKVDKFHEE